MNDGPKNNGDSPDRESESSGQNPEPPSDKEPSTGLSADQLSQAFAQFMDDGVPSDDEESGELAEPSSAGNEPSSDEDAPPENANSESKLDESVSPESILEAMLFVGHPQNETLSSRVLASVMRGVSPDEVDEIVADLNAKYDEQQTAYRIDLEGEGYRMALRKEFDSVRQTFYGRIREARLSQNAIDILSIVAYHQPIERSEVDKLKGKPSGGVLGQLVRRELLSVEHQGERPRKKFYRTTDRFLDLFNIESVEDLPRGEDF